MTIALSIAAIGGMVVWNSLLREELRSLDVAE